MNAQELDEYRRRWKALRSDIRGGSGLTESERAELKKLQDRSSCPSTWGGWYGTTKYPHRKDCRCGGPLSVTESVRKLALLYKRGG